MTPNPIGILNGQGGEILIEIIQEHGGIQAFPRTAAGHCLRRLSGWQTTATWKRSGRRRTQSPTRSSFEFSLPIDYSCSLVHNDYTSS